MNFSMSSSDHPILPRSFGTSIVIGLSSFLELVLRHLSLPSMLQDMAIFSSFLSFRPCVVLEGLNLRHEYFRVFNIEGWIFFHLLLFLAEFSVLVKSASQFESNWPGNYSTIPFFA